LTQTSYPRRAINLVYLSLFTFVLPAPGEDILNLNEELIGGVPPKKTYSFANIVTHPPQDGGCRSHRERLPTG
jgi:hypothetical protein